MHAQACPRMQLILAIVLVWEHFTEQVMHLIMAVAKELYRIQLIKSGLFNHSIHSQIGIQ